ncbi:MAG: molybdopterin-dependent oxidoreductase, partial [Dehalococcoidia bacterium]
AVIALDVHQSELQRVAHVMFPLRHAAEKFGTFTNCDGRVQRTWPGVEPTWEAYAEGDVLARLGSALGLEGFDGSFDARAVSKAMGAAVPALAGIDWDAVGEAGLPASGSAGR